MTPLPDIDLMIFVDGPLPFTDRRILAMTAAEMKVENDSQMGMSEAIFDAAAEWTTSDTDMGFDLWDYEQLIEHLSDRLEYRDPWAMILDKPEDLL